MTKIIHLDIRCLQDPNYKNRGIGRHVQSLLSNKPSGDIVYVGLVDNKLPPLEQRFEVLLNKISYDWQKNDIETFVSFSPMTYDTYFADSISKSAANMACIIYDFIPLDMEYYFTIRGFKDSYLKCVEGLKKYKTFFPISDFAKTRLIDVCNVSEDACQTTGVAINENLLNKNNVSNVKKDVLCVSGDEYRKNIQILFDALSKSDSKLFNLSIVGNFTGPTKNRLFAQYPHLIGKIRFTGEISDEQLCKLYNSCLFSICPSKMEGFSLPVAESIVVGTPVLASSCAAHQELVPSGSIMFDPNDANDLFEKIKIFVNNSEQRNYTLKEQQNAIVKFDQKTVSNIFWNKLMAVIQ